MRSVKRFEIVIGNIHLDNVTRTLEEAGATGYTVIRDVAGTGHRGGRPGDDVTDVFRNCMIICACDHDMAHRVAEKLRPILKNYGGVCLITESQWLVH